MKDPNEKKLVMHLPEGIAQALSRRHHGREGITQDEIIDARVQMQLLWNKYQEMRAKLEYCEGDWWDEMKVESHFMQSRWYYAHRKRKKLMASVKDLHKQMFYLLLHTDGNYELFDSGSMYAEDIFHDFMGKYKVEI